MFTLHGGLIVIFLLVILLFVLNYMHIVMISNRTSHLHNKQMATHCYNFKKIFKCSLLAPAIIIPLQYLLIHTKVQLGQFHMHYIPSSP